MNDRTIDFFVVGAPKTGTTSLSACLASHPQINFSNPKEPSYFSSDIASKVCLNRSLDSYYDNCYRWDIDSVLRGESSTTYLYSDMAVERILSINPRAKFIVGLRAPVSLAVSHYFQMLKMGYENQPTFEMAWALQKQRAMGKKIPSSCEIAFNLQYMEIISLGKYVLRLQRKVKEESLHIYLFEDLKRDFQTTYSGILAFLGVDDQRVAELEVKNPGQRPRSIALARIFRVLSQLRRNWGLSEFGVGLGRKLSDLNATSISSRAIDEGLERLIAEEVESDIRLLEAATGLDLSSWRRYGNRKSANISLPV